MLVFEQLAEKQRGMRSRWEATLRLERTLRSPLWHPTPFSPRREPTAVCLGRGGGGTIHEYLMLDAKDALLVDPEVGLVGVRQRPHARLHPRHEVGPRHPRCGAVEEHERLRRLGEVDLAVCTPDLINRGKGFTRPIKGWWTISGCEDYS